MMAARRMAGGADREGSVFFFLKKKEAKKTLLFWLRGSETQGIGAARWFSSLLGQ
jgi:hypothetical protein